MTVFKLYLKKSCNVKRIALIECKFDSEKFLWDALSLQSSTLQHLELREVEIQYKFFNNHFSLANLSNLTSINISESCNVKALTFSEAMLIRLFKMCPKLTNVTLQAINNITDEAILVLCQNASQLHTLSIYGCSLVTVVSIDNINKYCRNLKFVSIKNCGLLSNG